MERVLATSGDKAPLAMVAGGRSGSPIGETEGICEGGTAALADAAMPAFGSAGARADTTGGTAGADVGVTAGGVPD